MSDDHFKYDAVAKIIDPKSFEKWEKGDHFERMNVINRLTAAREKAKAIAALQDSPTSHVVGIPAGWKLVPIEPSIAMIEAVPFEMRGKAPWIEPGGTISWERADQNKIYRTMVEAAPEPEHKENSSFVPVHKKGTVVPDVLDNPARVGSVVFRKGVSVSAVIEAAQRLYTAEAPIEPSAQVAVPGELALSATAKEGE